MQLCTRNIVVVMALSCGLVTAATSAAATPDAVGGAEATAKKKCGKGTTRVKRKGRRSVCAKKCKSGYKHKVSRRGKVSCVRRRRSSTPAPGQPQANSGPKAGNYSGTTAQNRSVTFTVAGGQVTNFQAGVNTFCSTPGNSRIVIDAIANVPPMAVGPDGSFSYKGTSDEGNPEIAGKITGASASGTVGMNRGDTNYSGGQLTFGSCSASGVTWSAGG